MDMTSLSLLQALAPTVHALDQARALQECTALVNKYKARWFERRRTLGSSFVLSAG